jgi:hypothetical protein
MPSLEEMCRTAVFSQLAFRWEGVIPIAITPLDWSSLIMDDVLGLPFLSDSSSLRNGVVFGEM